MHGACLFRLGQKKGHRHFAYLRQGYRILWVDSSRENLLEHVLCRPVLRRSENDFRSSKIIFGHVFVVVEPFILQAMVRKSESWVHDLFWPKHPDTGRVRFCKVCNEEAPPDPAEVAKALREGRSLATLFSGAVTNDSSPSAMINVGSIVSIYRTRLRKSGRLLNMRANRLRKGAKTPPW